MRQNGYRNYPDQGGVVKGQRGGDAIPGGGFISSIVDPTTGSGGTLSSNEFILNTVTIPAGTLSAGNTFFTFTAGLQWTTNGTTPGLLVRIRRNGGAGAILYVWGFTTVNAAGGLVDFGVVASGFAIGGTTGDIRPSYGVMNTNGITPVTYVSGEANAVTGIDLFSSMTFDLTAQFDAAGANNRVFTYGAAFQAFRG